MIIFAGIDGTGEWSDKSYENSFANSHVKKMADQWPWPRLSFYHRGPSAAGLETGYYAKKAEYFIRKKLKSGEAKGIVLAGYSRGGAAVIEVAHWLRGFFSDIDVDCMVLFDAVDRSTEVGGLIFDTAIGDNVLTCLHAKRDPKAKSRESFGNCGKRVKARVSMEKEFFCTHGGLGGVPWKKTPKGKKYIDEGFPDNATLVTPARDVAGAAEVWDWANPKMLAVRAMVMSQIVAGKR
jgi:hypothetical protein